MALSLFSFVVSLEKSVPDNYFTPAELRWVELYLWCSLLWKMPVNPQNALSALLIAVGSSVESSVCVCLIFTLNYLNSCRITSCHLRDSSDAVWGWEWTQCFYMSRSVYLLCGFLLSLSEQLYHVCSSGRALSSKGKKINLSFQLSCQY